VPGGVIRQIAISRDGRKIGLLLDRPDHPTEVVVVDLDRHAVTQLTHSFLGGIDEADLIRPETIHYTTHDEREIPAFLYRPRGEGPFAVVLSIHGGPESQERPLYMYSGLYQYWLSRGIGVLAPNVRGSTGYGSTIRS
jgi:dipeptidyl aminopeptidase/acylaminoacyl peptidase